MKRLFTLTALLLAFAFCANAQGPQEAATRGKFSGAIHFIGRHIKESFTDCKTDKLWCAYLVGVNLINFADAGTTIEGQRQGFRESNPLLGHHPRTFKILGFTALMTGTQVTTMHMLREGFVDSCYRTHAEALANPNSKWAKRERTSLWKDPETCKYAMDVVPMMVWPYHVSIIVGNINDLTYTKPKEKK